MEYCKIKLKITTLFILFIILGNQKFSAQRKAPKCSEDSTYFMILDIKNMLVGAKPEAVSHYMLKSDHKLVVDSILLEKQQIEKQIAENVKTQEKLNSKLEEKDKTIQDKESIIAGKNKEIINLEQDKNGLTSNTEVLQQSIANYETKKELAKQKFSSLTKHIIRDNSASIKTLEQILAYGELIEALTDNIENYLDFKILLAEANKMFELKYDKVKTKNILQKINAVNLDKVLFANIFDDAELVIMDLEDYKDYTCKLKEAIQTVLDDGLSSQMTKVELKDIKLNQPDRYPYLYDEAEYAENNLKNRLTGLKCD
jgi:chromosome segregation ATPase